MKNEKVKFIKFHCMGWDYGEGNYKEENKQLIIDFDSLNLPKKSTYIIENQTIGYSDYLNLELKNYSIEIEQKFRV